MNLTSLSQVRNLLKELGIHPSKALGQNFLIDKNILDILLKTANLRHNDQVLEVGPGLGVVTECLLERVRRVVAVEKDRRLFDFLVDRFKGERGFELICADILDVDVVGKGGKRQEASGKGRDVERVRIGGINKVVSNLPYSSGGRILVDLVKSEVPPRRIVVTLQREVAQRLAARPGGRNYGLLSVLSQLVYRVELVKTVNPTCFWPEPEVRSQIVNMRRRSGPLLMPKEKNVFRALAKYAFTHRRKQLTTILSCAPGRLKVSRPQSRAMLEELGVSVKARPENLSVEDWLGLARYLVHHQSA